MKKNYRVVSLALAVILLLCLMPVLAADYSATSTLEAFAKNTTIGNTIQFTQKDFTSKTVGSDKLQGIILTSIPDSQIGELHNGTRVLLAGEAITLDQLDQLRYVPINNGISQTSFTCLPVFEGGVGTENIIISVAILEQPNRAPTAEDIQLTTYTNVAISGQFKAYDADGDPLTYKLTGKAKRGEITIDPDGRFTYTPYNNKKGNDTITYVAVDPYGNTSESAKITISIEKRKSKVTYSDMDDNTAHYAALYLAENNLLVGEKVGDRYFFHPETEVSRAEFLAIMVNCLGLGELTPSLRTGFADDDSIPTWAKPYVNLAVRSSLVTGVVQEDGRKKFLPNDPITRSQASVLLNKSLNIANNGVLSVFMDESQIPSWAFQSVANMQSVGLLDGDDIRQLSDSMTRAEVATLLCNALEVKDAQDAPKKSGLLSWVFG